MKVHLPPTAGDSTLHGPFVVDHGAFTFSAIGNVLITSQSGELTVNAMEEAGALHARVLAKYPGGTCMVAHLAKMVMPNASVRGAIQESMARFEATTLKRAIILSEQGFVASIVRSILGGMSVVGRSSTVERYFSEFPEAATFLTDALQPATVGPPSVLHAIQATVARHH